LFEINVTFFAVHPSILAVVDLLFKWPATFEVPIKIEIDLRVDKALNSKFTKKNIIITIDLNCNYSD
jgi:hypothetical protein